MAKKRKTKDHRLCSGKKSKQGHHLAEWRKNNPHLLKRTIKEAVESSTSSQGPSTSTPNISRQKIQNVIADIDSVLSENSIVLSEKNCHQNEIHEAIVSCSNFDDGYSSFVENKETASVTSDTHPAPHEAVQYYEIEEITSEDTGENSNDAPAVTLRILNVDESKTPNKETDPNLLKKMEGCRIIDITFYEEQIAALNNHQTPTDCNFSNMVLIKEKRSGVSFIRTFKCKMCSKEMKLYSHRYLKDRWDKTAGMNVNEAAVAATLLAGIGETALNSMFSGLDIPSMSTSTFAHYREKVAKNLKEVAIKTMYESAMKAKTIAEERGDISPDGFPLIPVMVDGAWCQRSYGKTYNSTGGCGAIIAADTNEVLYIGIRNKFCVICTKAKNKGIEPKEHVCFKNWDERRSSASMEADSIVQGFLESESMYGIRYHIMIADGDSSVYKRILEANPYPNMMVQKIECRGHLMRSFCSNVTADCLTSSDRNKEKCACKAYVLENILRLRCGLQKAAEHWHKEGITPQNIKALKKDIINAPSHVYGDHSNCARYFCDGNPKPGEVNMVPQLKNTGVYQAVMKRIDRLANNAKSLLHNVTTNAVESFNAIIASKISGKRVNYTARDSYEARIFGAVLSSSTGEPFRHLHKQSTKMSPGFFTKLMEKRVLRKRIFQKNKKKSRKCKSNKSDNGAADYGSFAESPDLDPTTYEEAEKRKLVEIQEQHHPKNIVKIELDTREQSDSHLWFQIRRNLVTASHVGTICKLKLTTSTATTVNSIVYSHHFQFDTEGMKWGRDHEKIAINAVEDYFDLQIMPCGLFIHEKHYFVGASPDGMIDDDGIVEVKCPFKARHLSVERGVAEGYIEFLSKDTFNLKKTHSYYYQVQTQLEVTRRSYCLFVTWTCVNWMVQTILRDEEFWGKCLPKIESFYFNSLIPEIVDPRKLRSLPLRGININGEECSQLKIPKKIEKPKKPKVGKKIVNSSKAEKPKTLRKPKTKTERKCVQTKKIEATENTTPLHITPNITVSFPTTSKISLPTKPIVIDSQRDPNSSIPLQGTYPIASTPVTSRGSAKTTQLSTTAGAKRRKLQKNITAAAEKNSTDHPTELNDSVMPSTSFC